MIRPSKAVIAGAAVAGLLTGSFAVRAYAASTMTTMPVSRCRPWQMPKKVNMGAKARTNVKGRAAVRPVTMAARRRTPAKAREVALPKGNSGSPAKTLVARFAGQPESTFGEGRPLFVVRKSEANAIRPSRRNR